jgi:hypothetical protein
MLSHRQLKASRYFAKMFPSLTQRTVVVLGILCCIDDPRSVCVIVSLRLRPLDTLSGAADYREYKDKKGA